MRNGGIPSAKASRKATPPDSSLIPPRERHCDGAYGARNSVDRALKLDRSVERARYASRCHGFVPCPYCIMVVPIGVRSLGYRTRLAFCKARTRENDEKCGSRLTISLSAQPAG